MMRPLLLIGLCALGGTGAGAQDLFEPGADGFDNPTYGSVPCIVLNRYEVEPAGQVEGATQYRASAALENICGRSLEVEFCFLAAIEEGETARNCYGAALRPYMSANVEKSAGPGRVVGTDYRWKYIPTGEAGS